MLQREFTEAILSGCRNEGIHWPSETAANVPWEWLERILTVTDLVMVMDIKVMDSERHRAAESNERILANARRLSDKGVPLICGLPSFPV